jgi:hypothetical protein
VRQPTRYGIDVIGCNGPLASGPGVRVGGRQPPQQQDGGNAFWSVDTPIKVDF